jgi:PGF-pre-PGF domain-containing protein
MEIKVKRTVAILLTVCVLVSLTASAVSGGFDSKKTTGKTTTIVEKFKDKSNLVSQIPKEEAYKSVNIWVGTGGVAASTVKNPVHKY